MTSDAEYDAVVKQRAYAALDEMYWLVETGNGLEQIEAAATTGTADALEAALTALQIIGAKKYGDD